MTKYQIDQETYDSLIDAFAAMCNTTNDSWDIDVFDARGSLRIEVISITREHRTNLSASLAQACITYALFNPLAFNHFVSLYDGQPSVRDNHMHYTKISAIYNKLTKAPPLIKTTRMTEHTVHQSSVQQQFQQAFDAFASNQERTAVNAVARRMRADVDDDTPSLLSHDDDCTTDSAHANRDYFRTLTQTFDATALDTAATQHEPEIPANKYIEQLLRIKDEADQFTINKEKHQQEQDEQRMRMFESDRSFTYPAILQNVFLSDPSDVTWDRVPSQFRAQMVVFMYMDARDLNGRHDPTLRKTINDANAYNIFTTLYNVLLDIAPIPDDDELVTMCTELATRIPDVEIPSEEAIKSKFAELPMFTEGIIQPHAIHDRSAPTSSIFNASNI